MHRPARGEALDGRPPPVDRRLTGLRHLPASAGPPSTGTSRACGTFQLPQDLHRPAPHRFAAPSSFLGTSGDRTGQPPTAPPDLGGAVGVFFGEQGPLPTCPSRKPPAPPFRDTPAFMSIGTSCRALHPSAIPEPMSTTYHETFYRHCSFGHTSYCDTPRVSCAEVLTIKIPLPPLTFQSPEGLGKGSANWRGFGIPGYIHDVGRRALVLPPINMTWAGF
jgi:hypothetical protein